MSANIPQLRRGVLETGGSFAATSGCLSSDHDPTETKSTTVEDSRDVPSTDGFAGNVVKTDSLLTDSRNVDGIAWNYDDGTVFADGANGDTASGTDSSTVVRAAVDSGRVLVRYSRTTSQRQRESCLGVRRENTLTLTSTNSDAPGTDATWTRVRTSVSTVTRP
jgi:hypothetical protein